VSKESTFEEAMKVLSDCADRISSPEISLEEAIACYEQGIAAYKTCFEILEKAEQKIETIEEALDD